MQFPLIHRARIKKTNLLERLFGEDRRRTEVIPRFRSETSALWLVFAVLVDVSEGWRGVRMKPLTRGTTQTDPRRSGEHLGEPRSGKIGRLKEKRNDDLMKKVMPNSFYKEETDLTEEWEGR